MAVTYAQTNIFPLRLGYSIDSNFLEYQNDLILWIKKFQQNNKSETVSNVRGWQSKGNFYLEEESFAPFMERIWSHITDSIHNFSKEIELEYLMDHGHKLNLTNIWINVNQHGAFNHVHVHPGSLLSGVLWIKVPDNSGYLVLRDPQEMNNYCLGQNAHPIIPKEGGMALFPAFIPHNVEINESDEERISISFNLDFA